MIRSGAWTGRSENYGTGTTPESEPANVVGATFDVTRMSRTDAMQNATGFTS